MGTAEIRPPVKLIAGFIFKNENIFLKTIIKLKDKFGETDFDSKIINFTHTDYYIKEFGTPLFRCFCSFKKLIEADELPKIKLFSNKLEDETLIASSRQINVDPGYLTAGKLILASTKNQQHRIYLTKGIYAEPELFFRNKTFNPWEWTYPDYQTKEYIDVFNQIRSIYISQIKLLGLRPL